MEFHWLLISLRLARCPLNVFPSCTNLVNYNIRSTRGHYKLIILFMTLKSERGVALW